MRISDWSSDVCSSDLIVVAFLTSAFWIIAYSNGADDEDVEAAGDTAVVETERGGEVEIAEGLVVGPTGLAIPVAGVRPNQLIDTYTQARAAGARVHDAIDIMAERGTPVVAAAPGVVEKRSEEEPAELQELMRIPVAVFCLQKKKKQ